jgi:hypothetical protein
VQFKKSGDDGTSFTYGLENIVEGGPVEPVGQEHTEEPESSEDDDDNEPDTISEFQEGGDDEFHDSTGASAHVGKLRGVVREYGIGYWFRFEGAQFSVDDAEDATRFISTASQSRDRSKIEANSLYVGLTRDKFLFQTYSASENQIVFGYHNTPKGLEGRWIFLYFSYSEEL